MTRLVACGRGFKSVLAVMTATPPPVSFFFFFNDPATTEFYPLPLHAALPISRAPRQSEAPRPEVRRAGRPLVRVQGGAAEPRGGGGGAGAAAHVHAVPAAGRAPVEPDRRLEIGRAHA